MKLHDIMRFAADKSISKEKLAIIVDAAFLQKQTQIVDATEKKDNGWRTTEQGKHYKINPKSGQIVAGNIGVAKPGQKVDSSKKTGKAQAKRTAAAAKAAKPDKFPSKRQVESYIKKIQKAVNADCDKQLKTAKRLMEGGYAGVQAMQNARKYADERRKSFEIWAAKYRQDSQASAKTKEGKTTSESIGASKKAPSLYVAPENVQKNKKWHQRYDNRIQKTKKDSLGSYPSATQVDLGMFENGTKISYQENGVKYTGVKKQNARGTDDHWVMESSSGELMPFYRHSDLAWHLHNAGGKFNITSKYEQQKDADSLSAPSSVPNENERAKNSMQRSVQNKSIRGAAISMDKYKPGTTISFTDRGKQYTYTKQPDKDGMPGAWLQNGTKNGFAVSSDIASAIIRNGGDFDVDWEKAGSPGGSLNMSAKSGTTPNVTQRIASFKDEIANDPKWAHLKDYTHVLGASDVVPTQQQTKEMHAKKLGNISSKLKPYAKSRYEHIVGEQPKITSDIVGACRDIGASMFGLPFRLKDAKDNSQGVCRIDEKIRQDMKKKGMSYQQATDGLGDIARYTQACTSENMVDNFNRTRQALQAKGYQFTKVKNTWDTFNEKNAYRGLNCTVMTPNGIPFELQFHTPQSLATKEAQHKLYEQARTEGTPADRVAQLNRIMLQNAKLLPRPAGIEKIVSEQRAYTPKSKSSDSARRVNAAKRKNPLFETRKSFGDF